MYLHYRSSGKPDIHSCQAPYNWKGVACMFSFSDGAWMRRHCGKSSPWPQPFFDPVFPTPGVSTCLGEKLLNLSANHLLLFIHLVFNLLNVRFDSVRWFLFSVETKLGRIWARHVRCPYPLMSNSYVFVSCSWMAS